MKNVRRIDGTAQPSVDHAKANRSSQKRVELSQQFLDRRLVAALEDVKKFLQFRGSHVRWPASGASN
jgi:hypothetical protein